MEAKTSAVENVSGDTAQCSKCEGPLDTTGYPKWCKVCRAKNKREYEATKKEMSETRGFCAGVTAAKAFLAGEFETKIRGASINGFEAARLVRACVGPDLPNN